MVILTNRTWFFVWQWVEESKLFNKQDPKSIYGLIRGLGHYPGILKAMHWPTFIIEFFLTELRTPASTKYFKVFTFWSSKQPQTSSLPPPCLTTVEAKSLVFRSKISQKCIFLMKYQWKSFNTKKQNITLQKIKTCWHLWKLFGLFYLYLNQLIALNMLCTVINSIMSVENRNPRSYVI